MTDETAAGGPIGDLAEVPPYLQPAFAQLISIVEAVERLDAEKAQTYAAAQRAGFSVKALKSVVHARKRLSAAKRATRGKIPQLYTAAIDLHQAADKGRQ